MGQNLIPYDLLSKAIDDGIIDLTIVEAEIERMQRQKYLEMHTQEIWQTDKGRWKTYLKTQDGRRLISASSKDELEDKIICHYQEKVESPTFEDVFKEWQSERVQYNEISKSTHDKYLNDFKRFFGESTIKNHKIKYITTEELDIYIRATIVNLNLTQKAYSAMRTILLGTFKYAKRKKYADLSITTYFKDLDLSKRMFRRNVVDPKSQVFSESEIPLLIGWLDKHPSVSNYGVILALQTGLRTGELSALKFSDVENNMLHVQRQVIKYKDLDNPGKTIHEVVDYCKTEMGDRYIYLTDSALNTIRKIKLLNPFNEYMMFENNQRILNNTFNKRLERACKNLDIPVRTMHKLRKTYGTTLIDNNVDESLIMEQMGHKDISTTRKYYYFANKDNEHKRDQIRNAINF